MARVEYKHDTNRSLQEAEGSDGRLNVSSRADSRSYYNSRDEKQTYSVCFEHVDAVAGEISLYIKNTSALKTLVISACGINTDEEARVQALFVSGSASGGTILTATNLNKGSSNDADAVIRQGGSGDPNTGLTEVSCFDYAAVKAGGHEELRVGDTVRLGQNDAVAMKYKQGTTGDLFGVCFMFFEE